MKKLSAVILTILMLSALTACGEKPNPAKSEDTPNVTSQDNASEDDASEDDNPDEDTSDEDTSGEDNSDEDNSGEDNSDEDNSDENNSNEGNSDEDNSDEGNSDEDESGENQPAEQSSTVKTSLPLKEYPSGSYFTKNGEACTDHGNCDWSADDCNCVNFDRSIQSMGFAKYVYYTVFDRHLTDEDKVDCNTDLTAQTAKQTLSELPEGAYIAVTLKNDVPHYMSAVSADDNGITVYQANYGGGCKVTVMTFTWEQFAAQFPHLDYIAK